MHIQVKTFVPGTKTCSVGAKAEKDYGAKFFWILGGIPEPASASPFEYVIIPSADMTRNVAAFHKRWLEAPGRGGRAHRDNAVRAVAVAKGAPSYFWSVVEYREQWSLLDAQL